MKRHLLLGGCLVLLGFATASFGQGVGASGEVRGVIRDSSGALMRNVSVTVLDTERGIRHVAVTDSTGQYLLAGLSPATYDVRTEMPGFGSQIRKGVVLNLGETVVMNFELKVSGMKEVVEVTSNPPLLDTARPSQADSVTDRYIGELPTDRRGVLTFVLLSSGVSNSSKTASNADFRVKQTPQSGLSFYGSNGRGNSVTVDGGEANDDTGGIRLNVSQDTVQEFQINRSNYSTELGSASGASINIVTKTGSNDLHATLFAFFRNDALDARDRFAMSQALQPGDPFSLTATGVPIKNSLNRQQFGGNAGFPVSKDRSFLYVAYEGLLSDAQDSVPLLTNSNIFAPTSTQQSIISGLAAQGARPVPCI